MVFICTREVHITSICSQHGETKTAGPPSKPCISVIQYISLSFNSSSLSLTFFLLVHYNIAHIALCASHQTIIPSYLPEYFKK